MKLLAGAILLLVSEQAFSHAYLVQFPHHIFASEVLVPASIVSLIPGIILLLWGLWEEATARTGPPPVSEAVPRPRSGETPPDPPVTETVH
ncbi:MAG: hypothetical protein VB858_06085 [Planctomycetaceae bacterium]